MCGSGQNSVESFRPTENDWYTENEGDLTRICTGSTVSSLILAQVMPIIEKYGILATVQLPFLVICSS